MPIKSEKDNNDLDDYEAQFKSESVENVLKMDKIYPTFKAESNIPYTAVILETPKPITTRLGKAYAMLIDTNGLTMSFITPNSFLFNLTVERKRNNLTKEQLIGKIIVFIKTMSNHKDYGLSEMYSVELKL